MAPLTFNGSNKEDNMEKLTHPIELSGEELDLVAAGWNQGCNREGSLITVNVSDNNVAAANNINVLSAFTGPQTVSQS
jgi:hypothetical protein